MGAFLRVAKIEWDWDEEADGPEAPEVVGNMGLEFHVPTIRENLKWVRTTDLIPTSPQMANIAQMLQALMDLWEQKEFTIKKVGGVK